MSDMEAHVYGLMKKAGYGQSNGALRQPLISDFFHLTSQVLSSGLSRMNDAYEDDTEFAAVVAKAADYGADVRQEETGAILE